MKNILFVMPSLGSGGAEKSLVNLLNLIDYEKYAVDLLLFKREGLFLSQIPKEVRLLQPTDSLQYAYKIDRGMFSSVSGVKAGILRGTSTFICKCLYKENARQQRWIKFYIAVGVVLRNFHWLQLLQASLLLNLVIAFICIVLQVAHVGNVSNVANLIAQVLEIAEEYIECDGWSCMTEMRIAIHGRATNIHAHVRSVERSESLFCTSESVILKCRTNGWISLQNVVQAKPIPTILWRDPWQMTPFGITSTDLRPGRSAVKHFGHWRNSSIQHTKSAFIP